MAKTELTLEDLRLEQLLKEGLAVLNHSFGDEYSDPNAKRSIMILIEFAPVKESTNKIDVLPHVKINVPKRTGEAIRAELQGEQLVFPGLTDSQTPRPIGLAK